MGRVTDRRRVLRVRDGRVDERPDTLTVEEPLEIRVAGRRLAVTMRTPGDDFALACGFLVAEGVIAEAGEVSRVVYCGGRDRSDPEAGNSYNVVDVVPAPGVAPPVASLERRVTTTSACGICGRTELEAVRTTARYTLASGPLVDPALLGSLPDRLRAAQRVFSRTGGLHAAGLFTGDGTTIDVREDVGRHNAVDKVVGRALQAGRLPLDGTVLLVSGRASFELVQKAVMAGIPILAAVSAPSSLAVDLALETGLTLVGFLRGGSMNIYAGAERVVLPAG
ncbi:formate dehydrogenase accessory sulfurtransferase FdhD [Streptomyces sp. ST2-7A]|uniref:formate dehydrogenase accessory sulfurtransferase FdhD n=1 Tax=Streptomyces sp. ST2-7A TaxID=2907214 RepID=UPI001F26AC00|nr:formate dehydrogenase accessory sulfurtransferase FdhD [Streptomyces sp. ST2-7A]MCE7081653.1 formate dehydrogenase accessory sulfurtransferase FdhD [Streptomyces sp. ST2-7A]